MNPGRFPRVGNPFGLKWCFDVPQAIAGGSRFTRRGFAVSREALRGTLGTTALGLLMATLLLLHGCRSLEPAPVDSRDLGAEEPPGHHRVRAGETLYAIAWRQGLDYRRVAEWNGVAPPYLIYPGQMIRVIPPETAEVSPKSTRKGGPVAKAPSSSEFKKPEAPKSSPGSQAASAAASGPLKWQWPVVGKVVQTYRNGDRTRQGIRIAGTLGQKVAAAEGGSVVYSGSGLIGYGNLIILKHDKDYLSAYGFNRKLLVKEGDRVARGEQVAELGQAPGGEYLLHFEIRRSGSAVDPLPLLSGK